MSRSPASVENYAERVIADEYPRPDLEGLCQRCCVTREDADRNAVIVSPSGMAHYGDGGSTECGHDATGDNWWWPL